MLTQEELKRHLFYCEETGVFTRKISISKRVKVGDVAGTIGDGGRIIINVNARRYFAHRLAWLYVHGTFPSQPIDHIDGNAGNNALCNLREVPQKINCQNRHRAQRNNKCGYLGVFWEKRFRAWIAKVTVNRKSIYVGTFKNPEEAHLAYLKAKRELHEGCTI